jgi:hypothetical protein
VVGDLDSRATHGKILWPVVTEKIAETKEPFYLLPGECFATGLIQQSEGFPNFSIIRAWIGWQQQGQWRRFAAGNKEKGFITRYWTIGARIRRCPT